LIVLVGLPVNFSEDVNELQDEDACAEDYPDESDDAFKSKSVFAGFCSHCVN